ncbi:uncharacterized protein LOC101850812 [Aplysia californica]|uniref:Uncharacterized protein LOC101850812 n=1 Tax=Aplysia californica TaxID=6500 RepID=A0ABM0JTK8_APLCA|nr:uncharacterized protein LOC101850812 [Aplysia californica]
MEGPPVNVSSLTTVTSPRSVRLPGLISLEDYDLVRTVILFIIDPVPLLFGIVSNFINVSVFCKMGVRDTVSVSFLVLSFSDLAVLLTGVVETACYLPTKFFSKSFQNAVDMFGLGLLISRYKQPFYNFSVFVPTYIAVTRCFCVTFPLQFGGMFTRFRTIVVLSVTFTSIVVLYIPSLTLQDMRYRFDPRRNVTRLVTYFDPKRTVWMPVYSLGFKNIYVNVCFITCCISTVILIISLKSAARTRRKIMGQTQADSTKSSSKVTKNIKDSSTHDTEASTKEYESVKGSGSKPPDGKTLTPRDVQVVKSVVLVTLTFICTHIPVVILADVVRLFVPEFRFLGRYSNSVLASFFVARTVVILSSACNILVYFNFNTKFRETLRAMCCKRGLENKY